MRSLSGHRRRRSPDPAGAAGHRPVAASRAHRRVRPGARLIAASLAGALLASVTAVVGASTTAVAAPGDPVTGPPVDTTVVIQSVGDGNAGAGGSGYQISGTELLFRATPPKGDEDNQWWYLQASAGGTYKVRSRTLGDRCMGRDSDAEGAARLAFRDCAGSGTDWEFHRVKGDQYRIRPVGHKEYLETPATVDKEERKNGGDVTFGTSETGGDKQLWYVTRVSPTKQAMPADPTFDQRTYLTSHNAYYNQDDADGAAAFPNQSHSIREQLARGVRGLMLDGYDSNGRVRMCHKVCLPTSRPLSNVFTDIADFLKDPANGNEIVTVFLEDYVTPEQLDAEVGDDLGPGGQLEGMVFDPKGPKLPGLGSGLAWDVEATGWPKVSDMVKHGKRLVLFSDRSDKTGIGFLRAKDWTAENYWSMGAGLGDSDWSCYSRWDEIPLAKEEPKFRRLFVMNHFRSVPMEDTARIDNSKLVNRAQRFCSPAARKKPNFVAVDQYDTSWAQPVPESDALAAVNELNTYTYHDDTPGQGGTPDELGENWTVPRLAVMPLGDSITEGAGSSTRSSYRAALWPALVPRAGTLDFVGSLKHGKLPDLDHEGHSGWLIEGLSANIDSWMDQAKPNVVLLHIGTNDMDRDHQVATAPARLAGLIDQMIAASPATTIVVASLVPSTSPAVQARIDAYNAQIPRIVAERQAQKHKVEFVSMDSLTTADLKDRLHPNDQGYVKMAGVFANGISQVARKGWISEQVVVRPAPVRTGLGDYQVDLNADGRADYLVVEANGAVRAWLNKGGDGRGGWTAAGQVASGVGVPADQVRFADVNADGFADYLSVATGGAVQAWLNKGGTGIGGWTAAGQIASGTGAPGSSVRFADVNADRRADYLVVDANGAVRAWLNEGGDGTGVGGGGWTPVDTFVVGVGAPADQIRWADINADRRDDYLVVAPDGSVRAWTNNGAAGGWTSAGQIATTVGAPGSSVRFADVNADGRADYLVLGADGSVQAWLNNGGIGRGGWTAVGVYASGTGAPAAQVRFADVDADGRADYLVVADDGSVRAWLNQGGNANGGWSSAIRLATGTGATGDQVRFADVDADGRADYLAVAADGSVKAWRNKDGAGNWEALGAYAPATGVPGAQVVFAEANGDGRADYVAVAPDGSARAWLNNGGEITGGWSGLGQIASGAGAPASQVHI
ncbi:FG-GAP-like repeat-containing protein [Streptomyces anulatus]